MGPIEVSERTKTRSDEAYARSMLVKFERSKILEIYFYRIDGRPLETIPHEYKDLLDIDLKLIKHFLLGQYPQDSILEKVFKIMN